jgi:hypothetical protein
LADLNLDREQLWDEALDLADDLHDAGADDDKVAAAVAEFLDALVPLDVLLPGLPGMVAEAADGPAFERAVKAIIGLFRQDPEKRAARKARRQKRRAERRARRAAGRADG